MAIETSVPIIHHSTLEIENPAFESLKNLIYGVEGSNIFERTKPVLFQEISEGVYFYSLQKHIDIPEFKYFIEPEGDDVDSLEVIARSYLSNNRGHIEISKNYLKNYSEFLNGNREVLSKYQIRPRETALHEMHHLFQMLHDPVNIERDVLVLEKEGTRAWLNTPTEIEAINVANEMQNIFVNTDKNNNTKKLDLSRKPTNSINLDGEVKDKIFNFLSALEDMDDVQKVYSNISIN